MLALTFLAGPVIATVIRRAWSCRREVDAWLLVVVSMVLLASAALCLTGMFNPTNNASWRRLYAVVGIVTAVLAVLLWIIYGVWGNWRTVALAAPLVPLLFGLAWGLGQINSINYDRGAWRQAGVLHEMPAPGWSDLQGRVVAISSLLGKGKGEGEIDLVLPLADRTLLETELLWALRSFPNVRVAAGVSQTAAPLVLHRRASSRA